MKNDNRKDNFIYFDNQASTPVDPRVCERMLPYLSEIYGNPHSNDHYFGWGAKKAVDAARRDVASLLNADADEVVFTSGAPSNIHAFCRLQEPQKSKALRFPTSPPLPKDLLKLNNLFLH
jgi:cysteine sulfinate desulfinase/cysteine desulfurase-like protein